MLNVTISLLFAGTLIGSLVAISIMLSSNRARIFAALRGEGGLAPFGAVPAPRYAASRSGRVRPVLRADRPALRAAA